MVDLTSLRTKMVDGQIRPNDVTDHRILEAMLTVPRELFVPAAQRELAYLDRDVPLGGGRVLVQPMVVAKLLQAAEIGEDDKVLEVGGATGYGAAIAGRLAREVVALEEDGGLAADAAAALEAAGTTNVSVVTGPLTAGHAAAAPYDVIVIAGSVERLPESLTGQLADGGRLVVVEGHGLSARAVLYTRSGRDVAGRVLMNAAVPLLPGFAREPEFVF